MSHIFPEVIRNLPEADIPLEGVKAYISQADDHQVVFMEFQKDLDVPEHSHCAQWGMVVSGKIELSIGGTRRIYTKGERYFIPEGVPHSAGVEAGLCGCNLFQRKKPVQTENAV